MAESKARNRILKCNASADNGILSYAEVLDVPLHFGTALPSLPIYDGTTGPAQRNALAANLALLFTPASVTS